MHYSFYARSKQSLVKFVCRMTSATTDLYGGALTAALPAGWIDASDLRPVPDNQEVCDTACAAALPAARRLTAPSSDSWHVRWRRQVWMERGGAERSLIVELMEQPAVPDAECAAIHFEDLATGNEAKRSAVTSCTQVAGSSTRLDCDPPCFHLHGVQTLAAGEGAECELQVRQHLSQACPPIASHQSPPRCALLQVQLLVARLAEFKTDLLVSISRPVAKSPPADEAAGAAADDVALALSVLDSIEIKDKGLFGE